MIDMITIAALAVILFFSIPCPQQNRLALFIQMNMKEYCERWVECFGKESEHVQLHALCEATGIGINVWCFEISHLSLVVMQEPKMNLLYRPGHYDILYY